MNRREFLAASAAAAALPRAAGAGSPTAAPRGKADACIFVWLGGGACPGATGGCGPA